MVLLVFGKRPFLKRRWGGLMGVYTRRWEAQTFRTFPDADANKPGLFRPGKNGKRPPGAENDRNCGVVARN